MLIYKGLKRKISPWHSCVASKLWAIKAAHVARAFFPLSSRFFRNLLMMCYSSRGCHLFSWWPLKKWSLADSNTYWVIKPLNNSLRDSYRADAICWLQADTSGLLSVVRRNVFCWNEKGSTPESGDLFELRFHWGGEERMEFFFFKLCTITLIRINKIFNYSSIQWLARPFVQMSLRARGARIGRCTQQFCDVLTDSDLVCHYPSRTLHWKGLSGDHCQHEEIRIKTFSGASKQGLTVKLAVISMTKFFFFYQGWWKASKCWEVFLFFCRVQSKSLCTFQSTFKFQDFSEAITWAPDSNWWNNMS